MSSWSVQGCVRTSQGYTDTCSCPVGLLQGCSLSPILFAMFIDEFYTLLCDCDVRGIQLLPNLTEIFLLMFADDIALIADTVVGLQRQLNILYDFCQRSKLVVNITKTTKMVFKRGGVLARSEKWTFNNCKIEVDNGFTYVGLFFYK